MTDNGGSPSEHRDVSQDRSRHVTCASQFSSVTVFIAIFTSWFRQRGRFISHPMQNSERERAAAGEIFTLQFGHVITPDIPQPVPTDASRVQSVYAVHPLFDFHRNILRQWWRCPLPLCRSFSINRVSNESKKIDVMLNTYWVLKKKKSGFRG